MLSPCSYAVTGTLLSILVIDHGLNWYYLPVVTGAAGLVWALGLRALTLHSLQNHKTRYKLSDNKRHTALTTSSGGSSEGTAVNGGSVMGVGLGIGKNNLRNPRMNICSPYHPFPPLLGFSIVLICPTLSLNRYPSSHPHSSPQH